jgi:hypothetical protein
MFVLHRNAQPPATWSNVSSLTLAVRPAVGTLQTLRLSPDVMPGLTVTNCTSYSQTARPDRPWDPPSLLHNGNGVPFTRVTRPGRHVSHPPLSRTEVEERVELYVLSPSRPSRPFLEQTFIHKFHTCNITNCRETENSKKADKDNRKVVPVHAMEAYGGKQRYTPLILKPGTGQKQKQKQTATHSS